LGVDALEIIGRLFFHHSRALEGEFGGLIHFESEIEIGDRVLAIASEIGAEFHEVRTFETTEGFRCRGLVFSSLGGRMILLFDKAGQCQSHNVGYADAEFLRQAHDGGVLGGAKAKRKRV